MGAPQQTSVLVRVQARGGKFLGPNVKYAMLSVLNDGQVIFGPELVAGYENSGGSGTVVDTPDIPSAPPASRDVIVAQPTYGGPPPGAYWLTPDGNTAGIVATFDLAEPALLEFRATALYDTDAPVTASVTMWVIPGLVLARDPGLLISFPGLVVSVEPSLSTGVGVGVTATVTMMCGCPITTPTWPEPPGGPEPYWPFPEFTVTAVLTPPSGPPTTREMEFLDTNTFTTSFPLPPAGVSTVAVYAVQELETNVGYAQASITVS